MALRTETGLTAPAGFIDDVYEIDKIIYSPELCGIKENMVLRYGKCRDSFILLYEAEKLIGYINFFPVSQELRTEMTDYRDLRMRDDDIRPEEIQGWSTELDNDVFIISVAILEEHRSREAITLLGDSFLAFLREKSEGGHTITSISGYTVSLGGVKFLKRLRASSLKQTEDGYHFFFADDEAVEELLEDGLVLNTYQKGYDDDLYFFLPMTFDPNCLARTGKLENEARLIVDREYSATDDFSGVDRGEFYCRQMYNHVKYECNSDTFKYGNLARYYLGEFQLACYDDDYDDVVLATETVHLFVTSHMNTGLYIVTAVVPDNHYNPTQLIDQMSTGHLDIQDPDTGDFLTIEAYIARYGLVICGDSKCLICMSNMPDTEMEMAYILSGETLISKHIDYHIREERREPLLRKRSVYDYYESYISDSVLAFVFNKYDNRRELWDKHGWEKRLGDETSELFIVEIVLFQNTAVLRTNRKVVAHLKDDGDMDLDDVDKLYKEFGKTMEFWNSDVFKYPFSQIEANEVIESFGITKTFEEYQRNQQFLDRHVELKSNQLERDADNTMNNILFFLSCFEAGSIIIMATQWVTTFITERAMGAAVTEALLATVSDVTGVCATIGTIIMAIIIFHLGIKRKKKKKKKASPRNTDKEHIL